MSEDEQEKSINQYMNNYNIPDATVKQKLCNRVNTKQHVQKHIMILLKMVLHNSLSCYNIYMDVINEIEVMETGVKDCN